MAKNTGKGKKPKLSLVKSTLSSKMPMIPKKGYMDMQPRDKIGRWR